MNLAGMKVHVNPRPGPRVVRFPMHPFCCWLSKFIRFDPWIEVEYPGEPDPIMWKTWAGAELILTNRQYLALKDMIS